MDGVKISGLPGTSSIDGSEIMPVVKGGNTINISVKQIFDLAVSNEIKRAGREHTFALLCIRASREISSVQHSAALMCWCLFIVILIPLPLPQSEKPIFTSCFSTAIANGWA